MSICLCLYLLFPFICADSRIICGICCVLLTEQSDLTELLYSITSVIAGSREESENWTNPAITEVLL